VRPWCFSAGGSQPANLPVMREPTCAPAQCGSCAAMAC
jgi:hypothetical protein